MADGTRATVSWFPDRFFLASPSPIFGLYPRWDGSGEPRPFLYASPGQRTSFAHVGLLPEVELSHQLSADHKRLVLTAVIPRSVLPATVPVLTDGWRTMGNFEVTIGGSRKLWWSNADGSASRETKDEPTEVAIAFPQQHQNNLTVWLDEQQLAETSREQGVYHTVDSPQAVPLASGWNRLRVRGYALGYDLHFGAVLQADPATLWELRLSATPPE